MPASDRSLIRLTSPAPLDDDAVRAALAKAFAGQFRGARMLVIVPDHTRTAPLPLFFRALNEILHDVRQLDFLVALGTHPPLPEAAMCRLFGITAEERADQYARVGLLNHAWDDPRALADIGVISRAEVQAFAGPAWHESLGGDVPVQINRLALEYDHLLIVGPVFPHEVVGFSGGAKYLFPGISGPDLINVTHWLGALITVRDTIGLKHTPMRAMIHAAAAMVPTPVTLAGLVVDGSGLHGLFIGDHQQAWEAAADYSAERHIVWVEKPFQRALSVTPPMYDELWTGAKAMYKLDPAIADGGEIIVYAPHLDTVSHVHGHHIYRIGYHVRDYFLKQWDRFKDVPLGVLAHSTHLRGGGRFENGVESPRIQVTLASRLGSADCAALGLGYADPARIDVRDWQGREAEGILYVPKAGEILYRLRG